MKSFKLFSYTKFVWIPQLCDLGMRGPELPDDKEDPYAIGNHNKGNPLFHSLLTFKEVDGPVNVMHQQSIPVVISVEVELCTTRSLESKFPYHCCHIILIEQVS